MAPSLGNCFSCCSVNSLLILIAVIKYVVTSLVREVWFSLAQGLRHICHDGWGGLVVEHGAGASHFLTSWQKEKQTKENATDQIKPFPIFILF